MGNGSGNYTFKVYFGSSIALSPLFLKKVLVHCAFCWSIIADFWKFLERLFRLYKETWYLYLVTEPTRPTYLCLVSFLSCFLWSQWTLWNYVSPWYFFSWIHFQMHHLFPSWKKAWTNSVICLTHGILLPPSCFQTLSNPRTLLSSWAL